MTDKFYTSRCGDDVIHDTPENLVRKYEGMAYAEERAGNQIKAQLYFNYAEHWKRYGRR